MFVKWPIGYDYYSISIVSEADYYFTFYYIVILFVLMWVWARWLAVYYVWIIKHSSVHLPILQ